MPKPISTSKDKHPAAVALGKLGKGRRKTMTPAALAARQTTAKNRSAAVVARHLEQIRAQFEKQPLLTDEEVQLPAGPLGAGVTEEDVD